MLSRICLLVFLPAGAAVAQFSFIELRFEGVGCAPCIESMPERMKRLRGVESASVDAAKGLLTVKLAQQNRVRVEQIRDAIEQDGTKARSATVQIRGKADADRMLSAQGVSAQYRLEGKDVKAGECMVTGEIAEMRPSSPPLIIRISEQKMLP